MKILVTGADGFIATNLIVQLELNEEIKVYKFTKNDSLAILDAYLKEVDFIYHLAGVNRPENSSEFYQGNSELTQFLTDKLMQYNRKTPIVFSSSTQVLLDNDYGKSKLKAEEILLNYSKNGSVSVCIYRLPNVFGKWARPNYNSVIATWCHNLNNGLPLKINDEEKELQLVYIDDVVTSLIERLYNIQKQVSYYEIEKVYIKKLGEIKSLLYQFQANRKTLFIPKVGSGFERALYATYLSYIKIDNFSYRLNGYQDKRGTFYEILKTVDSGQFSISTTAPGITRGNHYHNTKNEKFLVVKGEALIEFRNIITDEKTSYTVSDKTMEIVEMIPGYTHNIINIGNEDMILIIWANENYDPKAPDTNFVEV